MIRPRATSLTHAAVGMTLVMAGCGGGERSGAASPAVFRELEAGEGLLANLRQLTFDGQNAESYFASDGTRLIFQRTGEAESGRDSDGRRWRCAKPARGRGRYLRSPARDAPNNGHSEAHAGLPVLTHNGLWVSMDSSISRQYHLAHRVLR